jgi:4-diphosphocytidyl-2-C-methyl-D-erythritol kinase
MNNLVVKGYLLLKEKFDIPPVAMHLYKNIPMGAGLGGGSSDGAFALKMINDLFELQLSENEIHQFAAQLGADCAFFIRNTPQLVKGIGDELTPHKLSLKGKKLLLINDGTHIKTAEAYHGVVPKTPTLLIENIIESPLEEWKDALINDFEETVFSKYPNVKKIKDELYRAGARYAAMTGSGSTLFGIFEADKEIDIPFDSTHGFIKEITL